MGDRGYDAPMPVPVMMLSIPATVLLLAAVLVWSTVAERRVLSPRALVFRVVQARRTTPDFVEAFVARECQHLLMPRAGTLNRNGRGATRP